MPELIRIRYNTMAHEGPDSPPRWRIIVEDPGCDSGSREELVDEIRGSTPWFTKSDSMPIVGRKHHIACEGTLTIEGRVAVISA